MHTHQYCIYHTNSCGNTPEEKKSVSVDIQVSICAFLKKKFVLVRK